MSGKNRPPLVAKGDTQTFSRLRELAADLVEARRAAQGAADRELEAELAAKRARIDEMRRLADEVVAMAAAVADHPEVVELGDAVTSPPPTVHGDTPDFVLRDIHEALRERVDEVLPDLDAETSDARDATPSENHTSVEVHEPLASSAELAPEEAALLESDAAEPTVPTSTSVRRCVQCGATIDSDSEHCPSCGQLARAPGDGTETEDQPARPEGDTGWGFWAFVRHVFLFAAILVAFANAWPQALQRAPVACELPLLQSLVPCEGSCSGVRGHVRGLVGGCEFVRVTSVQELLTSLASPSGDARAPIRVAAGTYDISSSVTLTGNVELQGDGRDETILRMSGPALTFAGGGLWTAADLTFARSNTSTGDVIIVTGGEVRFDRVAFSGGSGTESAVGAGIVFAGDTGGTVRRCDVRRNTFGIVVVDRAEPTIDDCMIEGNAHRGVSYHDRGGGVLRQSTITNNGYAGGNDYWQGVGLEDRAAPSIVANDIRRNAGVGIQFRDSTGGTASDNRVLGNGWNIQDHGPALASTGGIAIGTNGTDQRPSPSLSSNVVDDNYDDGSGSEINDYR